MAARDVSLAGRACKANTYRHACVWPTRAGSGSGGSLGNWWVKAVQLVTFPIEGTGYSLGTLSNTKPSMQTCGDPVTDDALSAAPGEPSVDDWLNQAIECHRNWKFDEAFELYHRVLQEDSVHAEANHNLGVLLAIQLLRPLDALPYFEAALNADAQSVQYWFSYIDALIRAGQSDMARQLLPLAQAQRSRRRRACHRP